MAVLAAVVSLGACDPGAATPVPEPPTATPDLNRISTVSDVSIVSFPRPISIVGTAGAVEPNAILRATNLDSMLEPIATTALADGSFTTNVPASPGDEIRLQAVLEGNRSAPADVVFSEIPDRITPVVRSDCIGLDPGLERDFQTSGLAPVSMPIRFENRCADALTLSNYRLRLGLTEFVIETADPLQIPAGDSGTLEVRFEPSANLSVEDTLFIDVATGTEVIRYPITLFGVTDN
jgi:hypothetical protein